MAGEKDLEPYVAQVKDAALAHALSFGVGYIHETQPARERQVVEYLFDAGAIQVRVVRVVCRYGCVHVCVHVRVCVRWWSLAVSGCVERRQWACVGRGALQGCLNAGTQSTLG